MDQIRRVSLADQAADLLLARIRAGEWRLGSKLPGETTLAPQLGVGRSTVREAIRQLAGRGLLQTQQGAGVFVTALDVAEEWDAVLRRASVVSVLEGRIAIETEAAALAAQRRTPADVRSMRRALTVRGAGAATLEELVDTDTALHRAVVAAAHNDVLLELFDGFVPRVRQAMVDMLRMRASSGRVGSHSPDGDQAVHASLVQAVADRDAAAAAELSRTHLSSLKEALA